MACINGISIKSVTKFKGHDGEKLYQGNLYLGKTKIGFWSQGYWSGIVDEVHLLPGYCETKLRAALASYKSEEYDSELSLELLMYDLLSLHNIEKEYKSFKRKYGNKAVIGLLMTTDNYHYAFWPIFKEDKEKDILELFKKELQVVQKDFLKNAKITTKYYSVHDFTVGDPIDLQIIVKKSVD